MTDAKVGTHTAHVEQALEIAAQVARDHFAGLDPDDEVTPATFADLANGIVQAIAAADLVSNANAHASMLAALKRSREELELAEKQWMAPSRDGLFQSRVSVLLDRIDAALALAEPTPSDTVRNGGK